MDLWTMPHEPRSRTYGRWWSMTKPRADVVASYLKRESFEVHLAHDGRGALTLARRLDPESPS